MIFLGMDICIIILHKSHWLKKDHVAVKRPKGGTCDEKYMVGFKAKQPGKKESLLCKT